MDEPTFWDGEARNPTLPSWMEPAIVRAYINESVSGVNHWPLEWLTLTVNRRFDRALSVGCGSGALERSLLDLDLCESIDAFDASPVSLQVAREEADRRPDGHRVNYFQADFNDISLPRNAYDIVFFHQSLHHVSRLERLLRQVARALRENGILYLEEYIGPSRGYWTKATFAPYQAIYQLIPRNMRWAEDLLLPINYDDLTEAIRSGEILSRLQIGFDIEHFRGYGGNVLAVVIAGLNTLRMDEATWRALINAERSLIAGGAPHFHAVIVARPKRSMRGLWATIAYLAAPKWRRLGREVRRALGLDWVTAVEERRFRL